MVAQQLYAKPDPNQTQRLYAAIQSAADAARNATSPGDIRAAVQGCVWAVRNFISKTDLPDAYIKDLEGYIDDIEPEANVTPFAVWNCAPLPQDEDARKVLYQRYLAHVGDMTADAMYFMPPWEDQHA